MSNSHNPLGPVSELWIGHNERDDDCQQEQRAAHDIKNQWFDKHFLCVFRAKGRQSGQSGTAVKVVVCHVGHPFAIGDAVGVVWK